MRELISPVLQTMRQCNCHHSADEETEAGDVLPEAPQHQTGTHADYRQPGLRLPSGNGDGRLRAAGRHSRFSRGSVGSARHRLSPSERPRWVLAGWGGGRARPTRGL